MGARIPVQIIKPHTSYKLTSGDIERITEKILLQLEENEAILLAKQLCKELKIETKE